MNDFLQTPGIAAIIATCSRPDSLRVALQSMVQWQTHPSRILIVDASDDSQTQQVCAASTPGLRSDVQWIPASRKGAAAQRNQGVAAASEPFVWFMDDDVKLLTDCARQMLQALETDPEIGGVNATITNQGYHPPGVATRSLFRMLHPVREQTYAGRVIGPGVNLLPEDRPDLPDIVSVEWLNTTCTMYRREALPDPPFARFFEGYSLMEDLALSLNVAKRGWKLANVRTARIVHDSQPGEHKSDVALLSAMELVNRHYIMTKVLDRRHLTDHLKLAVYELFQLAATLRQYPRTLPQVLRGKIKGLATIRRQIRENRR